MKKINRIDEIRKLKQLSYREIAKRTGLSATYIYLLATGERQNPSLTVMQKIAAALGKKVEDIFTLNE
mgnify:CR=1 FL=1